MFVHQALNFILHDAEHSAYLMECMFPTEQTILRAVQLYVDRLLEQPSHGEKTLKSGRECNEQQQMAIDIITKLAQTRAVPLPVLQYGNPSHAPAAPVVHLPLPPFIIYGPPGTGQ